MFVLHNIIDIFIVGENDIFFIKQREKHLRHCKGYFIFAIYFLLSFFPLGTCDLLFI